MQIVSAYAYCARDSSSFILLINILFRSLAGGVYFAVQISRGMRAEEEAGWTAVTDTNELERFIKLFFLQ